MLSTSQICLSSGLLSTDDWLAEMSCSEVFYVSKLLKNIEFSLTEIKP